MIIWGVVVVLLVSSIYVIWLFKKDDLKYSSLEDELTVAINEYIQTEHVHVPSDGLVITEKELINKGYINEVKLDDLECTFTSKVTKSGLTYSYDYNFDCK